MALIVSDRVKETTSTTGTGTYTLAGALPSYASFADIGNGNTTYYACTDGTDWEVGIGTYTASGTTLARTTILQSSNSDAAVNWGSGIKTIFCTLPAEKYIFKDADGHVSIADDLYVSNKIIHIGDTDTYMNFPADETWQVVTQNSSAIKATELQITLGRNVISTYNATFTGNVNAAQFRAQADTSYYLDPDGDSVLSNIQLYNNDAGASAGPTFELYRDSASPASSDQLGEIIFSGKDSSGNKNNNIRIYQDYVQILSTQRIPSLIIGATAEIAGLQQSELNVFEANRGSVSLMGDVLVVGGASATIKENFTAEKNLNVDGLLKTDTILSATDPGTIGIGLTATGSSTLNDLTLTGNLTVTGTVDGRDVSVDGAKLDLIEAGATADQTKADIDALGINADQVDGLEASQFLRSDANDTGTKLTLETLNLTSDNTSSKHLTLTNDTGPNLTVQVYGSGSSTLTIENASTSTDLLSLTDAGNLTVAGTVEGRNLVNDGAKLDLIEAGATADQTKADIDALGIDADQLDGQEGTYYLDYNNFTNTPTIPTVPTNVSAFTNDAGYITSADGGNADQLDGQEGTYYLDYNNFTNTPTIPTNNNQLTNGAGYITNTLTSTDAGATAGPTFELYRNSASPAAADLMGEIRFEGEDYDGTKVLNGWIYSRYSTLGSAFRIPEVIIEAGYRAGSTTATPEVFKGSAGGVSLFDGKLTVESGGVTIPDDLTVETNASVDGLFQTDLILGSTDVTKGIGLTSTGSSSLHNLSLSGTLTSSISAGSTALDLATNDGYAQMRVIRNATTNTTNDDGMFIGYGNSSSGVTRIYGGGATSGGIVVSGSGVNDVTIAGSTAWHAGNDGSGSGLDADLLDGVQGSSYLRSDANDTATGNVTFSGVIYNDVIVGNTDNTKSVVLTAAGTTNLHDLDLDGNLTIAGTVDGRDVSVDGAKLDGIEAGATADQTASEILTAIKTVDGSGSGLDADLLDGVQGSSYLRSDTSDTFTTLSGTQLNLGGMVSLQESTDRGDLLQITSNTSTWGGLQIRNSSNEGRWSFMTDGSTAGIYDDENGDWHIQWSENAGAIFYHNGLQSLQLVDSTGIRVGSNTSSNIYMQDTDGTERRIHCNSGQVGFLDSSNNWSAFSSNAGDWYSMVSSRAPIFYDYNNTNYYLDLTSGGKFLGNFEFASNSTSTSYSVASIELRESNYTANGTATPPFLGFHWGGIVASSIALESSGRIAIRNNPGTGYENFIAATITSTGTVDAPQFRDSNNTGYYADPASTSRLNAIDFGTSGYYIHAGNWGMRNTTPDGYIEFGPANTSHAHIYTDRPNFYFNKELYVNGYLVWNYGNDGSGSGLDADLLDGVQGGSYLRSDADDTWSGNIQTTSTNGIRFGNANQMDTNDGFIAAGRFASGLNIVGTQTVSGTGRQVRVWGSLITDGGQSYWHAGNDGAGSGLDADLLDGLSPATTATGNTIAQRDASGHIYGNYILGSYFNASSGNSENPTIGQIWTQSTADNYLRKSTPAHFISQLGLLTTSGTANSSNSLQYTGYGTSVLTAHQLSTNWQTWTGGWATHIIGNHGNGSNYYNQTIIMPFWGAPQYMRKEGGTNVGPYKFWTEENDGFGSGLDADLLDGLQASQLLRSDVSDTMSGDLTLTGTVYLSEKIAHYGDTDTWISFSSDDTISLVVGNSTAIKCLNYIEVRKNILSTGNATFASTVDATQFRDKDNTSYYVDPAGYSKLDRLHVAGSAPFSGSSAVYSDERMALSVGDAGLEAIVYQSLYNNSSYPDYGMVFVHGDGTNRNVWSISPDGPAKGNLLGFLYDLNSTNIHTGTYRFWLDGSGNSYSQVSSRAQIFYDSNNTSYYVDPASTSVLGQVNLVNANVLVNYVNGTGNSIYNSIAGSGSSNLYWKHGTSGANLMYLDSSGNLTAIGNVTAYSDIKLKDNIQVIDNAIDKVKQIRGVTFTRNDMHDDKRQTGVIAQEVEQVLPEVVTESDYDGIKSVAYGNMVGLLIEAIKEQQKQIEALQEQINGFTK